MNKISLIIFVGIIKIISINCHGRLLNPPGRSSAWREDKRFPSYFDDNQMFCGGFDTQWNKNGGKCGICGEDWSKPKQFEKGGALYRGISVRTYSKNQVIDVTVELTANHLGYFQFGICNVDSLSSDATQSCIDQNVLTDMNGNQRIPIVANNLGKMNFKLRLPTNLVCTHCVLQWKYNTGNSQGVDPATKKSCVGCGPQEQFYGCADVTISSGSARKRGWSINPPMYGNDYGNYGSSYLTASLSDSSDSTLISTSLLQQIYTQLQLLKQLQSQLIPVANTATTQPPVVTVPTVVQPLNVIKLLPSSLYGIKREEINYDNNAEAVQEFAHYPNYKRSLILADNSEDDKNPQIKSDERNRFNLRNLFASDMKK